MQTKVLIRCLEELNNKEPNLSYLKGMLETIIAFSDKSNLLIKATPEQEASQIVLKNPEKEVVLDSSEFDEVLNAYTHGKTGELN